MARLISPDTQALVAKIAARRRRMGLSQRELGKRAGLSESYVSHLERGFRNPSAHTLVSLCHALETTPNALMVDSLPEHLYGEASASPLPGRRRPAGSVYNTLSNWLLTDTPDESLLEEDDTDVNLLPPIGFLSLVDDMPVAPLNDDPYDAEDSHSA